MGDALTELALRRATTDDAPLLHAWRNDPETRRNSISTEEIPFDEHAAWLARKLANDGCVLYIVCEGDEPVAHVRLDRLDDDAAEISVTVAPTARGRGIGRAAIAAATEAGAEALGVTRVVARVKPENGASRSAFTAAGYAAVAHHEPLQIFERRL